MNDLQIKFFKTYHIHRKTICKEFQNQSIILIHTKFYDLIRL